MPTQGHEEKKFQKVSPSDRALKEIQAESLPDLLQIRESASLEKFFGIGKQINLELKNLKKKHPDIVSMSDEDKAELLFRWLMQSEESIRETKSDRRWIRAPLKYEENKSSPRHFFSEGTAANCFGSAILYTAIARRLGLTADFVYVHEQDNGSQIPHACSSVELNGKIALMDTTCDTLAGFDVKHRGWLKMSDREVYFLFMSIYYKNKEDNRFSEAYIRKILGDNPNFVSGWYTLGDIFLRRNDTESAEKMYEKALELYPRHMLTLDKMANICLGNGDLIKARDYITGGLAVDPKNPLLLCTFGEVLEDERDYENAAKAFVGSIENSDTMPQDLASSLRDSSLAGLHRASEELIHARADNAPLFASMGRAFLKGGQPESAIFYLERVDTISPNNPHILRLLAIAYNVIGDTETARSFYRRSREINPKTEAPVVN